MQATIDLAESVTKVAKAPASARKRIAKAAGVARLDEATAAAVTAADLILDQAAAVAVYADNEDATTALIGAATAGPGQFAHALTRAKHAREQAQRAAALLAELTEAGRRVLDAADGAQLSSLSQLAHDGEDLTSEAHAACEGSAVCLSSSWDGVRAVEVCTDPARYGHANRYSGSTMLPAAGVTDEERAAASDARRAVIVGNRDMAAANETRREWVRTLLLRKTAPKGALRFAVETMTSDPRPLSRWLSGQSNAAQDGASADLHIETPGLWSTARGEPTLTSGEQLSDGRLPVALLGHVAGAIETGVPQAHLAQPQRQRRPGGCASWSATATPWPRSSSRSSTRPTPGPATTAPSPTRPPTRMPPTTDSRRGRPPAAPPQPSRYPATSATGRVPGLPRGSRARPAAGASGHPSASCRRAWRPDALAGHASTEQQA